MGAGYCEGDKFVKEYKDYYFCTNPEYFIRNHYPLENNKYQLLNKVVSTKEFASMVVLADTFYGKGFKTISQNNAIFTTKGNYQMDITFEKGKNYLVLAIWKYKSGNQYIEEGKSQANCSSGNIQVRISPQKKTQYELWLAGGPATSSTTYPVFAVYRFTNS